MAVSGNARRRSMLQASQPSMRLPQGERSGVGSGNTARRIMGMPPQKIAEFDAYLKTLVPLLRGEEAWIKHGERNIPVKHIMPNDGFVNFEDPIPLSFRGSVRNLLLLQDLW